MEAMKGMPRS
nr:probable methionine-tRNA ligase attenuator peptide - Thermus aquaticus [Thermus aquaticus]